MDDRGTCALTFGEEHFGAARLGDARRTRRLVQLADQVVKRPGGTLPDKIDNPASLKALYRLMNQTEVTHDTVLAPSRERTLQLMREAEGTVLVIHDSTELDYSNLSIEALGQIGNGRGRGYLTHNVIAVVAETGDVIGLAYQKLAKRPRVSKSETREELRRRSDRESRLWKDASATIPAAAPGHRQVEVADRGADVLEFLDYQESRGKSYLVRSKHNRRIQRENGQNALLHDFARTLPAMGAKTAAVRSTKQRASRQAELAVAWAEVTVLIPKQPRGEVRGVPLKTWVVRVWEPDPPKDTEPLEWILLTNVPVRTVEDAQERIRWYERRWIIEEYHKALKTGVSVEEMQFTSEDRLKPAIALLSVAALFLLNMRSASRREETQNRPASEYIPLMFVKVLALWRYKRTHDDLTVHQFYYALARLGGHQNRKQDHPPGWLVLWRGWMKLQSMVDIASQMDFKRCG
jgi:hypothetical protein